jgi:cobalt-zinc-cadmium efflux system membrane fusion protein
MRATDRNATPLLLLLLALGLSVGCGRGGEDRDAPHGHADESEHAEADAHEPEIPDSVRLTGAAIAESGIQTWKVQSMDLEHLLVLTGTIGHDENRLLHVASNLRGRVAEIPVDLGQRVRKGDPIVWIESVDLSHAWDEYVKALSDLRIAERAYERARSLLETKAISAGEYQSREGAYLARKVEAATLERTLRQYGEGEDEIAAVRTAVETNAEVPLPAGGPHRLAVRSPFDGKIIDRKVTPGTLVEALQPLVGVADLSSVWVFLKAYEKDLALLEKGLTVAIRADAYPQESFAGRIDFLGSVVDAGSRTIQVRATVDNREEKLRPGMFVKATVDVPRPQSEAHPVVAVPQSALQTLEARTVVFVQTEPGVFVRRTVEVGHTFEGFTEILAGVEVGDDVVTEGSFVLKSEFAKATLKEDH